MPSALTAALLHFTTPLGLARMRMTGMCLMTLESPRVGMRLRETLVHIVHSVVLAVVCRVFYFQGGGV